MTSAIETALTELSANLRRMEQRHQATGYKFDRLYGLIDAAREELARLTADAPSVLPESDGTAKLPYFSYDSDSGVEFHATEADAIKWCEEALSCYRQDSIDGWPDEAESLRWGRVLGRTVQCDIRPIEDHPEFTESCDYTLIPYCSEATK